MKQVLRNLKHQVVVESAPCLRIPTLSDVMSTPPKCIFTRSPSLSLSIFGSLTPLDCHSGRFVATALPSLLRRISPAGREMMTPMPLRMDSVKSCRLFVAPIPFPLHVCSSLIGRVPYLFCASGAEFPIVFEEGNRRSGN